MYKVGYERTIDTPGNVHDTTFNNRFATNETITLVDQGFKQRAGAPATFKVCRRGTWGERIWIETLFSLWTRVCHFKHSFHRTVAGFRAKVGYLATLTNLVVNLNRGLGFPRLSRAQWSL